MTQNGNDNTRNGYDDNKWHLDKRVPIALIFAIALQTAGAIWWASTTSARLDHLERRVDASSPQADRLTRVEVKIEAIQEGVLEIKRLISPAR